MRAPRSYTGEDVVEIHCHGSSVVVDTLIGAAILAGARLAEAGEFTRRAVLNGRMDLVQAEAVADLIDAPVLSGAKAAWRRLSGSLSAEVVELRGRLLSALADIEAHIDFSDDDLPDEDSAERERLLDATRCELEHLLGQFAAARRERDGYRVVLAGKPNVGKSSLLNGLLGFDRAIVSEEPGTTRDAIMETVDLRGLGLVITDTAGVRATESVSESVAVARSLREAASADILVRVFDGSNPLTDADLSVLQLRCEEGAEICVINKSDLTPGLTADDRRQLEESGCPVVCASAVATNGCDELKNTLAAVAHGLEGDAGESAGLAVMEIGDQAELASLEVRRAIAEIATITGVFDNEEVLDSIFASFCIGK
jgi:tRNA modification GTPase